MDGGGEATNRNGGFMSDIYNIGRDEMNDEEGGELFVGRWSCEKIYAVEPVPPDLEKNQNQMNPQAPQRSTIHFSGQTRCARHDLVGLCRCTFVHGRLPRDLIKRFSQAHKFR